MAQRRAANRIRGPHSALTDFLAANNISAQQIRDSYEQRSQLTQAAAAAASTTEEQEELDQEIAELLEETEEPESSKKKRKRHEEDKSGKSSKKSRKSKKKRPDDDYSDHDLDDVLGKAMYTKAKPNPGQLGNCEVCEKRFTVTAYSKTGPDGGLVCGPCGRDLIQDPDSLGNKVKKTIGGGKARRKTESNRLDGLVTQGAKALQQLCVEKVADHHLDIEDFGDMPDPILNRLGEIFAKRRVVDPRTIRLFLRPDLNTIAIHDCAKLEVNDYKEMFAVSPTVTNLVLRNACQFKDTVVEYMLEKATDITHFKVYAANLVSNEMWIKFFETQGPKLKSLQLEWLDACFTDEVVAVMAANCTSLRRLKLKYCRQLTSETLAHIAKITTLQHLSLHFSQPVTASNLEQLVGAVGSNLLTLSLESCPELDDTVVHRIRTTCQYLSKLRLTPLDSVTDSALSALFGGNPTACPTVVPALIFLDLNSARDVDNNNPDGPIDAPIGLASESFKALMKHSGSKLQHLQIPSCRHISRAALWDVFIGTAKNQKSTTMQYTELREINCSFLPGIDTSIVVGMFKSCPKLKKVVAFGCFQIEDVKVPKGVALIGVPRAQDVIEQFGDSAALGSDGFLGALTTMHEGSRAIGVRG